MKKQCNKKKFTFKGALGYLVFLKNKGYKDKPWRTEVSYYKCENCESYHITSQLESSSNTVIKNKSYFDFQKENWSKWIHNKSSKKGNI
jgi:hypothetical protein